MQEICTASQSKIFMFCTLYTTVHCTCVQYSEDIGQYSLQCCHGQNSLLLEWNNSMKLWLNIFNHKITFRHCKVCIGNPEVTLPNLSCTSASVSVTQVYNSCHGTPRYSFHDYTYVPLVMATCTVRYSLVTLGFQPVNIIRTGI